MELFADNLWCYMNINEKTCEIEKIIMHLIDMCWCFVGTGLDIYVETLLRLCSSYGMVVAIICCGRLPHDTHSAEAALRTGHKFFEIAHAANLKAFSEFLDVQSCQLSANEKPLRSRVQTNFAGIWNDKRCRQTHRRLTSTKEIAFAQDADALLSQGVALRTAARWLSARHQVSRVSAMNRLKFTRNAKAREKAESPDGGWLSADYLDLRKACVQVLLQNALTACPTNQVTEQDLSEAILAVATVCSRLSVWRTRKTWAWWFAFVEKVVAGKVSLTRRERTNSPHKKHYEEKD